MARLPSARRLRHSGAPAALALVLGLGALLAPSVQALPGDAARADLLVRQGVALLHASRDAEAREYALRALEFSDLSADAHALIGRLEIRSGRHDRGAAELGRAVALGGLAALPEPAVRKELALALLRMRRPAEASGAVRAIAPAEWDAEASLILARAAWRSGDLPGARALAREAASRFPDDDVTWVLLAAIERADNRLGESRRILEAARLRLPGSSAILAALLDDARTAAAAADLAAAYFALPSRSATEDLRAALAALRHDPSRASAWLERLLASGGLADQRALETARSLLASRATELAALEKAAAAWSGERLADTDADGFPDNRYRIVAGALAAWGVDLDQDGLEELVVSFGASGLPATVSLHDVSASGLPHPTLARELRLVYASYPAVSSLAVKQGSRERVYDLRPGVFRFPLVPGSAFGASPRLDRAPAFPREQEIRAAAAAAADYSLPERARVARLRFLNGAVARLDGDVDGDGRDDRVVLFEGGLPASGQRDLDNDGVFETREYYAGGALERIEVDTNGDGRADYARRFGAEGREEWDLDADGTMDVLRSLAVAERLRALAGLRRAP